MTMSDPFGFSQFIFPNRIGFFSIARAHMSHTFSVFSCRKQRK